MTLRDPIGVSLGSIAAGATAGASVITLGLVVFRALPGGGAELNLDQQFLVISAGLGAGMLTTIGLSLALSNAIVDWWRRGVIAASSVFGASILAALTTAVDIFAGGIGLILYAAVLFATAGFSLTRARAAAQA